TTQDAGYQAALAMDNDGEQFAGESKSLLSITRLGQSQLERVIDQAWKGPSLPGWGQSFNFNSPVRLNKLIVDDLPIRLISGGKPVTIHADSRYQVPEIIAETDAIAAVDGAFFSLKYLDSNVIIGPVLSQYTYEFIPGNPSENVKLINRPLVLISPDAVNFVRFNPEQHNSLAGIRERYPDVTDVFVGAAWLVKRGRPQPARTFGDLFGYDAYRHRAFWGINHAGEPVIGVSADRIDSVGLGKILSKLGFRDAIMLDSGASTSLAYQGESLVAHEPRPVPHVVALVPPRSYAADCVLVAKGFAPE
ncbi:MAG: phosphodiester glycosidase family protein, partial [Cyanothece sp. SIO1E1]|nr:phosphodiester glycosidase family protein [Cyanothece sp. SIO1E1]